MTNIDIIRMAREAGLHRQQHNLMSNPVQYRFSYDGYEENLERFAALIRADAIAEEREACAKVCDVLANDYGKAGLPMPYQALAATAKEIRSRSNT